ncbi:MAG: hypothetical protein DRO18_04790, partial [Thermoprotei archaeon]
MVKVKIEVEVRPTEDIEKVIKAVKNVLDVEDLDVVKGGLPEFYILTKEFDSLRPLTKLHQVL